MGRTPPDMAAIVRRNRPHDGTSLRDQDETIGHGPGKLVFPEVNQAIAFFHDTHPGRHIPLPESNVLTFRLQCVRG